MTPPSLSAPAQQIVQRFERLPYTSWHLKVRAIMGIATFFDGLDALAIAYVLPVLVGLWHLKPTQVGLLISIGYGGQALGAVFFGFLAERKGRVRVTSYTIAIYSVLSFCCAAAPNYAALLVLRSLQGIGLGGEVPVSIAYVNEVAKAKARGRFVVLYEVIFPIGAATAGLLGLWLVPAYGWQPMFLIGGLPALLAIALRRLLPESPRWLASRGRLEEAERVVASIETIAAHERARADDGPPVAIETPRDPPARSVLEGIYLRRTLGVWALWFITFFVGQSIITWLPTVYRSTFHLPVATSIRYGLITHAASIVGNLIAGFSADRLGRKTLFVGGFVLASIGLLVLALTGADDLRTVVILASVNQCFIGIAMVTLFVYTPEIYPTRMRALGTGLCSGWQRTAVVIGPLFFGFMMSSYSLSRVLVCFSAMLLLAAGVAAAFATETKGRVLEELSP